jgi:dipeptidyl aminopeptidase/acylaminoacyl peptidase
MGVKERRPLAAFLLARGERPWRLPTVAWMTARPGHGGIASFAPADVPGLPSSTFLHFSEFEPMKFRPVWLALSLIAVLPAAAAERGFDVRDLVKLDRYSSPTLSPDGARLVFARRVMNAELTKASTALYLRDLRTGDLAAPRQITPEGWNVSAPAFSPDGQTVYFLSDTSGSQQLHAVPASGGQPRQLTDFAVGVDGFRLSPSGDRIVFSAGVFQDCGSDLACTRQRLDAAENAKATGKVFDSLFVRHWDTWNDGRRNTLFVAPLPAAGAGPVVGASAISATIAGDAPSKPFGGMEDIAWSPDGKSVVASIRVAGKREPWSTNFDLYLLDAGGRAAPKNLTAANPAWDAGPVFSADGKTLYYRAMKRPGFEADRFGLMAMDLASGKLSEIAANWDRSAGEIVLADDGKAIYTTADDMGEHPLFRIEVASGKVDKLVGQGSIGSPTLAGPTLAFTRNSLHSGDQVFVAQADGQSPRAITPSAQQMLPEVKFGDYQQFSFKGWNQETVHGYVVKPYDYQEGKRYPVAFLIHGGPQGSFGNGWSYRWNPQTYAGQGYAVVMIDQPALGRPPAGRPAEGLGRRAGAVPLPRWRQGLRTGRQLRRLHGVLGRRQLVQVRWKRAVEVPGRPRRRVRQPHDGLQHRGAMVFRVGKRWQPVGQSGEVRAVQPHQPRQGLEDADPGDPRPAGLPHPGRAGPGRVHRRPGPGA